MKKVILSLAIVAGAITGMSAQSACSKYVQFIEGTTFTMSNYNAKGKLTSTTDTKVTKVTSSGSTSTSQFEQHLKDSKGKEEAVSNSQVVCTGNSIKVDIGSMMMGGAMGETYKDYDLSFEGNIVEYPSNMTVGQSLPDIDMTMVMKKNGTEVMRMHMKMTNRKVAAKETKVTPAGSFECYKLTYDYEGEMGGMVKIPMHGKGAEWFSYGFGMIRTESYSPSGELRSSSEMTALHKGA